MRGAANEYFTTLILLDVRQLALSFVKLCKGETQVCYDPSKEPPRSREEDPCERPIIGIGKRKTARKENVWGNESGSTQRVNLEVILLKKLAGALLFGAL